MMRWDEWVRLRELAVKNYPGPPEKLPPSLKDPLPPRPQPFVDDDMGDVSADLLNHGGQFEGISESFQLERSIADDHVPLADPGLQKPAVSENAPIKELGDDAEGRFHFAAADRGPYPRSRTSTY
jgi:serine/threonine-protein phosphatase 2A regulatory subunit B'